MSAINFHTLAPAKVIAKATEDVVIDVEFEVMDPLPGEDYLDIKLIFIPADDSAIEAKGKKSEADLMAALGVGGTGREQMRLCANEQVLDELDVGPLGKTGRRKFQLVGEAPDLAKLKKEHQLDVGAMVMSAAYKGQEFFRLGWYVKHEYEDQKLNETNPKGEYINPNRPKTLEIEKCQRVFDHQHPLETKFEIRWGNEHATGGVDFSVDTEPGAKRQKQLGAYGDAGGLGA